MLLFKYSRDLWSSAYWSLVQPVGFYIWSPWGSGHLYFLQTWHFTNIQRESLSPAHSTFTPVSMPVVETLKSRYANISGVGGLYSWGNLFLGKSSAMKKKTTLISIRHIGTWKSLLFNWFAKALLWTNMAPGICWSLGFSYLTKQLTYVTPRSGLGISTPLGNINEAHLHQVNVFTRRLVRGSVTRCSNPALPFTIKVTSELFNLFVSVSLSLKWEKDLPSQDW